MDFLDNEPDFFEEKFSPCLSNSIRTFRTLPLTDSEEYQIKDLINYSLDKTKVNLFLIGYPCDIGAFRSKERIGQEGTPKHFRRMLEEMKISPNNSFYGINIDDYVNILDCGDIIMEPYCLENIHSHLEYTVSSLLIQNNSKIFLIGGTNDSTKCTFSSLAKCQLAKSEEEKEKIGLIHIDSSFDIEKIANKEEKSTSIFRDIHKKAGKSSKSEIEIVHFGGSGVRCSSEDEEFIKKRNGSLYWINRHIRTTDTSSRVTESEEGIEEMKMKDKWRETETQAGMLFSQIVEKLSKEEKQIIVSFDVASMQSKYCPGVSNPSVIGGLTLQEACEIALISGACSNIKIFELVGINPSIEHHQSISFALQVFFNYLIGIALNQKSIIIP